MGHPDLIRDLDNGLAELHDEAFGCAAGFEELGEGDFDDVKAAEFELMA